MDDYTYGGTSLSFYPQIQFGDEPIIEHEIDEPQKGQSRAKIFARKFMVQCAVCATVLAILMLIGLFNNSFFSNITQSINHEITTNTSVSELFSSDGRLAGIWQTARSWFTTTQPNEPVTPYSVYPEQNIANDITPPAISTDNIAIDPELLEQINSR